MKNHHDPNDLAIPSAPDKPASFNSRPTAKRGAEKSEAPTPLRLAKVPRIAYPVGKTDDGGFVRYSPVPRIRRRSMTPSKIDRRPIRSLWRMISGKHSLGKEKNRDRAASLSSGAADNGPFEIDWRSRVKRRRVILALLVFGQTALAVWSLARTFPYPQLSILEIAILVTFSILFSWISFSFWSGIAGFCNLMRRIRTTRVNFVSAPDLPKAYLERSPSSRTAVLVPVCNEEIERVVAGVEASYRSLAATGTIDKFDFYFLSDTSDPEKQVQEEFAWAQICQRVDGFGRIFYRHRRVNIKRKSGNIADFVRRWGQKYDYMIVFDADSIMAGGTMLCMANMMDLHPQVGILQTAPTIVNRESLFARVQQFASRVYGPIFNAGLRFWQGGESYYWGHNAILRVMPFAEHCGLARLPGRPPLGGDILSHDFVEAALMGRAGWEVWILDDLPGSFEESPPTILDELKRDRRWCQGNLQHLRLICADGFRFGHRAIMAMGVMAYASAFFWAVFLILSTAEVVVESLMPPVYFSSQPSLFPAWPQWHPEIAIALLSMTAAMLFLAKFLSFLVVVVSGDAVRYGGALRLGLSAIFEILLSTLLAPIRMWFHSKYVFLTLLGREIKWGAQCRDGAETGWLEASRQHGFLTVVGLAWTAGLFWLNPLLAGWVLPVTVPMSLSIPLSVFTSRAALGIILRRCRLLLIPEETDPPEVIQRLQQLQREGTATGEARDFVQTVEGALANARHTAFKFPGPGNAKERHVRSREKTVVEGSPKLANAEIAQLLHEKELAIRLGANPRPNNADDFV